MSELKRLESESVRFDGDFHSTSPCGSAVGGKKTLSKLPMKKHNGCPRGAHVGISLDAQFSLAGRAKTTALEGHLRKSLLVDWGRVLGRKKKYEGRDHRSRPFLSSHRVNVPHMVMRIMMADGTACGSTGHPVMMCEMAGHSADRRTFQAAARKDGR